MNSIPADRRMPKEQYRNYRKQLEAVCLVTNLNFREVWNIMVAEMEADPTLTLAKAVEDMTAEAYKEFAARNLQAVEVVGD